jgi:DmsE family decaheme c-type cytochrome
LGHDTANSGSIGGWLWLGPGRLGAAAKPRSVDWAKLNAGFTGATFVGDASTCAACHEDAVRAFEGTSHARAIPHAETGADKCESCHGPRSKHVENPTGELAFSKLTAPQQSSVCLQCHEGGARFGWKTGAHQSSDVSCTSCHSVMKAKSEKALGEGLLRQACLTCRRGAQRDPQARTIQFVRAHGLLELPQPHGSTPGLLVKNTLNETCTSCHRSEAPSWGTPPCEAAPIATRRTARTAATCSPARTRSCA